MDILLFVHIVATTLVIVRAAVVLDEDMLEIRRILRDECIEETGVDTSLLDKVDNGAELMPDEILKCYMKCTMETSGLMSDGIVEIDTVLALLPEEIKDRNEDMLRKCDTQLGKDDCETAFLTQLCWQKGNKDDYFLI